MEIIYKKISVTKCEVPLFIHQVNCKGVMGSGVARHVKKDYYSVYLDYVKLCESVTSSNELLGTAQFIKGGDGKWIVNLFSQEDFNRKFGGEGNTQFTDYEAMRTGLRYIRDFCSANHIESLAMPHLMGCVRGGGDWNTVLSIITDVFTGSVVKTIYICEL